MKVSSDWSDIINVRRREIAFENRNKNYGGYILRKQYCSHILIALIITIVFLTVIIIAPLIFSHFSNLNLNNGIKTREGITLQEPPPIDKFNPPPPPPEIPPPPVLQTIKFTPPKVVKEEIVDEPPPTQDEVKDVQVSTTTQAGENTIDLPPETKKESDDDKIFTVVQEMPSFPGGEKKLYELLSRIRYPTFAKENYITGYVYLAFVIDKEGKIKDATVIKGIGGGCDEEALRVLNSLPDWKPGRQNGRNVQVKNSIRIGFFLN